MDMRNIKPLAKNKYRVRFKYMDPLTEQQVVYQRTLSGVTLAEARAHRDEARAQALRRPRETDTSLRVKHCVSSYVRARATRDKGRRSRSIAPRTLEGETGIIDLHIIPEIGEWVVAAIDHDHLDGVVDRWCAKLTPQGKPYSPHTINLWLQIMRQLVAHAAKRARVDDPGRDLQGVAADTEPKGRALSLEEVAQLLDWLKTHRPQHWAMTLIGLTTGARFGELAALHWDQVDEDAQLITFDHNLTSKGVRVRRTKTGAVVKAPLLPEMAKTLTWHRERLLSTGHPRARGSVVFPSTAKATIPYLRSASYGARLRYAAEQLGLEHVSPHDLRRTFTTLMFSEGAQKRVVQSITGHTNDATTEGYDRVPDADKRVAVGALLVAIEGGKGQRRVNEGAKDEQKAI